MNPIDEAQRISHKLVRIDKLEAHDQARRSAYYERMRQDVVQSLAPEVRRVLEAASLLPEHLRTPPLQSDHCDGDHAPPICADKECWRIEQPGGRHAGDPIRPAVLYDDEPDIEDRYGDPEPGTPIPASRMGFAQAIGAVADALPTEEPAIPAALLREPPPIAPGSRLEIPDKPRERLTGKARAR
jgi:hypothetical protein